MIFWTTRLLTFLQKEFIIYTMRLKNVPFKKSLKDELRTPKSPTRSKTYPGVNPKELDLKNPPTPGSVEETKQILKNLRRIWGSQNTKTSK